jgi:uracil-DNA glycosylase
MSELRLTLLVGTHARIGVGAGQDDRTGEELSRSPADGFSLPHPSWRSRHWAAKNPWFEEDVLPALRQAVQEALA